MPSTRCSATLRDAKNQTSVVRWYASGAVDEFGANAAITAALIDAASNCSMDGFTGSPPVAPVAGSSSGKWIDVEDKGVVVIQTASGAIHKIEVPAPVDGFFLPDGETMNGAGPGQALGLNYIALNTTRDGIGFASVVGGYRARVKLQRRFNVRTRDPQLTGQGL